MAFCIMCGEELSNKAKFCSNCGAPVDSTVQTKREFVYEGTIHKCPSCGEILDSFISNCTACGYELRGVNSSDKVQEFAARLESMETEKQKISFIESFPVPNTKEDVFEFLILAATNISEKDNSEISEAWRSKAKQCYEKAQFMFGQKKEFEALQNIYDRILSIQQKKRANEMVEILLRNILVLCGLVALIIALILDLSWKDPSLIGIIGCTALIIAAMTLSRRNAPIIDYGITAISGIITILLAGAFWDGSLLVVCGGITLIATGIVYKKKTKEKI